MRLVLGAVILASMTSVASAGGTYLGLGIGSETSGGWERTDGASYSGDMDGYGRSGRLMVGRRFATRFAVEAQGSRFNLEMDQNGTYQATQLAAALKLTLPLGSNFEFFAKGGIERTWLTPDISASGGAMESHAGNGLLLGAGFEYRLDLGVTGASIFVDYQRASSGFESDMTAATWDGVTSMWTLGATVSL